MWRHRRGWVVAALGLVLTTRSWAAESVDIEALKGSIAVATTTVADTATAIPTTALAGRRNITVINTAATTVYLGPSTVTSSTGFQLETDTALSLDIGSGVVLYGITASGTADVRSIETR